VLEQLQRLVLVPVLVEPMDLAEEAPLLAPRILVDLVGVDEPDARRRLLAALGSLQRGRSAYPGGVPQAAVRFPGVLPQVWSVPRRNPQFTGRDRLLQGCTRS
jgi:hypothetical protein